MGCVLEWEDIKASAPPAAAEITRGEFVLPLSAFGAPVSPGVVSPGGSEGLEYPIPGKLGHYDFLCPGLD